VADVAVPGAVWTEPAAQAPMGRQAAALSASLYVPASHAAQVRSPTAAPSAATRNPGEQVVHAMHGLAALASSSQVPALHATWASPPPGQYVPASQAAHWTGELGVAGAVCRDPARQALAGWQVLAFASLLYSPAAQAAQVRSAPAVPWTTTCSPATQSVHGVHRAAPSVDENAPLGQAAHTASAAGVPGMPT
jgi:hypothetical protein